MSYEASDKAWQVEGLKPQSKLLLLALAKCQNATTKRCFPSYEALASMTGLFSRSIGRKWLPALLEAGLVEIVSSATSHGNTQEYVIHLPTKQRGKAPNGGLNGPVLPDGGANGGLSDQNGGPISQNGGLNGPVNGGLNSPPKKEWKKELKEKEKEKPLSKAESANLLAALSEQILKGKISCETGFTSAVRSKTSKPKGNGVAVVSPGYEPNSLKQLDDSTLCDCYKRIRRQAGVMRGNNVAGKVTPESQFALSQLNVNIKAVENDLTRRGINPKSLNRIG